MQTVVTFICLLQVGAMCVQYSHCQIFIVLWLQYSWFCYCV